MNPDPMIPPDENRAAIRALLETLHRQQGPVASPETDDLVRWLEGTLPPELASGIELALAHNPDLRRALVALRLGHEDPVSVDELARLENLVAAPAVEVVPFPVPSRRGSLVGYLAAAAAAVALLLPAWTIGSGIAEQRRQAEDRALREFLSPLMMRGGL